MKKIVLLKEEGWMKIHSIFLLRTLTVLGIRSSTNSYNAISARNTSQKTIFITGGGGYIASHTILELLNQNYSVIAIDNMANCYAQPGDMPESLKRVQKMTGKRIIFHDMDVMHTNALHKIFKEAKIDCVIHMAALKLAGESMKIPLKYYSNNVVGSAELTEIMNENNVKKLIFSSSSAVYGEPHFQPVTEAHQTGNCTNPYGRTKYFCEEIFKDICTTDPEWKVVCLRYFKVVGADKSGLIGEDNLGAPSNIMPHIAEVAVGKRDKVKIYGSDYPTRDGTGVHDFVHITDVANGHIKVLEKIFASSFKGWKAYNLASGTSSSMLELIDAFSNSCGKPLRYEIVSRRDGDISECQADLSLIKRELKWVATRDLKQICDDAWKWQNKNPNGYKNDQ